MGIETGFQQDIGPIPPRPGSGQGTLRAIAIAATIGIADLRSDTAQAHVKWFVPFDLAQPPLPIGQVLSSGFVTLATGFTLLMFVGFFLDHLAGRQKPVFLTLPFADAEERILRAGVGASFIALFAAGNTILTPEMATSDVWVGGLQFAIAACMLSRRSCALGGLGILGLYVYAGYRYGPFHVTDYVFFVGLATYLVLTSFASERLRALRMPILYVTVCGSLMWAAVEKWVYPHWVYPLLEAHPHLMLGFSPWLVVAVAGFVEFTVAFFILTGLALLRPTLLVLVAILMVAIPEFGKVDAIGHLPLITALAAMFLHGPTQLHRWLHHASRHPILEGFRGSGVFMACTGIFVAVYYGMWSAERGSFTPRAAMMAQATLDRGHP